MKEIRRPSVEEVERCLEKWHSHESLVNYQIQERVIVSLFKQFPRNTKIEEVLHKVTVLNYFHSTGIFDPFEIAQHIVALNIDKPLRKGEADIVDKIAKVPMGGTIVRFYSFATKYCSHHRPEAYPVYDSHVREVLAYFNQQDNFAGFSKNAIWEDYPAFKQAMLAFQTFYNLCDYKLPDINRYLWLLGREMFRRF
jgi:hypothetical protein